MHYFGNPRHTQSGDSGEKLHCGNVITFVLLEWNYLGLSYDLILILYFLCAVISKESFGK